MKKISIMIAVMFAFTMMAMNVMGQNSPKGEIQVNIHIQSFVEVEVIDPVLDFDVTGTSAHEDDMGFHSGQEAKFEVRANDQHTLKIESSNGTWKDAANLSPPFHEYKQVKFLNTNGDGSFIGGNLYLIDVANPGASIYWDGNAGNIVNPNLPAGTKTWGIAARGRAVHYGDGGNLTGIEGALAPPGIYQTDALITASID